MTLQQRTQNYKVSLNFSDTDLTNVSDVPVASYVPPTTRNTPVVRNNGKYGQQVLPGPTSYSDLTLVIDLLLSDGEGSNSAKTAIDQLQSMINSDVDTVQVVLSPVELSGGEEKATYYTVCDDCVVSEIKYEDQDRNSDSTMLRATILLQPTLVQELAFGASV